MNFPELLATRKRAMQTLQGRVNAAVQKHDALADRFKAGDYADETERAAMSREKANLLAQLETMTPELNDLKEELRVLQREADADDLLTVLSERTYKVDPPDFSHNRGRGTGQTTTVRVGQEPRTYTAEREANGESSFLRDLFAAQRRNDPDAMIRLQRHGEEARVDSPKLVERAVNTGGVAAFTPPAYLVSMFAEYLRAGRPTANLCNSSVPLPAEGMVVNIPRITTGSSAAAQAAENASIGNQDVDDTTLPVPVVTIAGFVDMSRQSLERGQLVEPVIFGDLAADYASQVDSQVINGAGSGGEHLGILGTSGISTVTYTTTTPTLVTLWPKLADAIGRITGTRFTGPTAITMRPNVWSWILSQLGSDNRPLVTAGEAGPNNAMAVQVGSDYANAVGSLQGVPVMLDGNIPNTLGTATNETTIIIADFRDAFLMEEKDGMPVQLRFDDVGSSTLTSRLLVYGYSAFTAGRQPKAVSKIVGTGLIVPAL